MANRGYVRRNINRNQLRTIIERVASNNRNTRRKIYGLERGAIFECIGSKVGNILRDNDRDKFVAVTEDSTKAMDILKVTNLIKTHDALPIIKQPAERCRRFCLLKRYLTVAISIKLSHAGILGSRILEYDIPCHRLPSLLILIDQILISIGERTEDTTLDGLGAGRFKGGVLGGSVEGHLEAIGECAGKGNYVVPFTRLKSAAVRSGKSNALLTIYDFLDSRDTIDKSKLHLTCDDLIVLPLEYDFFDAFLGEGEADAAGNVVEGKIQASGLGQSDVGILGETPSPSGLFARKSRCNRFSVRCGIRTIGVDSPRHVIRTCSLIGTGDNTDCPREGRYGDILCILGKEPSTGSIEEHLDLIGGLPIDLGAPVNKRRPCFSCTFLIGTDGDGFGGVNRLTRTGEEGETRNGKN